MGGEQKEKHQEEFEKTTNERSLDTHPSPELKVAFQVGPLRLLRMRVYHVNDVEVECELGLSGSRKSLNGSRAGGKPEGWSAGVARRSL